MFGRAADTPARPSARSFPLVAAVWATAFILLLEEPFVVKSVFTACFAIGRAAFSEFFPLV